MPIALAEMLERSSVVPSALVGELQAVPPIIAVECDTRRVRENSLFCCIQGVATDGHQYAARAVALGATALLVQAELPIAIPQIVVEDTRVATGQLAAVLHRNPSRHLNIVGITGTNGKTTVAYLVEGMSRSAGVESGLIGTIETRFATSIIPSTHTTPNQCDLQALLGEMVAAGVSDVAMEVSSHALDQRRVAGTDFAAVCLTNLGHDHLDYHRNRSEYANAKARLFDGTYGDVVVLNAADEFGAKLIELSRSRHAEVWSYGTRDSSVAADLIESSVSGTTFRIFGRRVSKPRHMEVPLVGAFNVENVLCAISAQLAIGKDLDALQSGLENFGGVPGRLERIQVHGVERNVFVDYAHTADALSTIMATMRPLLNEGAQLRVLYGCGGDRDSSKRSLMARAVANGADVAVLTSDNPRSEDPEAIAADALRGIETVAQRPHVELDRRTAIETIIANAAPNDIVIIAGKGHETTQTIGTDVLAFDDRVVARAVLEGLR